MVDAQSLIPPTAYFYKQQWQQRKPKLKYIEINAYSAPYFTRAIDQKTLPKSIKSKWATIIREDLAPNSN